MVAKEQIYHFPFTHTVAKPACSVQIWGVYYEGCCLDFLRGAFGSMYHVIQGVKQE